MKFDGPQFLHKREMFFCCDSHSGASEWSHRTRGTFQALPNDVCGEASGRPAILEGELLGEIGNAREARCWFPGHCGLLHVPALLSWGGPLAVAEVAELWFSNHNSATVTVSVALLRQLERCRTATVVPLRLKRRAGSLEGSTNDAARMAGPGRICFAPLDFLFSFCSPVNDRAPFMQSRRGGSSAKFF